MDEIIGRTCISAQYMSWTIENCTYQYNHIEAGSLIQDYWLALINFLFIVFLYLLPYWLLVKFFWNERKRYLMQKSNENDKNK